MQLYTISQQSLVNGPAAGFTEDYIPLWMASGTSVNGSVSPASLVLDGANGSASLTSPTTPSKLFTLSTNWRPTQKFAFEASIVVSNGVSGVTICAALYDLTSGTAVQVGGSVVSLTSPYAGNVRSGQFNLIPGHVYGVGVYSQGSYGCWLIDASLVVLR